MVDGQLWLLASPAWSLIDVNGYGTKAWLVVGAAVLAIGAYVFGLWKAYRFSKGQMVKRLLESDTLSPCPGNPTIPSFAISSRRWPSSIGARPPARSIG